MARARKSSSTTTQALGLLVMVLVGECYGQCGDNFKVGYYDGKCGEVDIEAIVYHVVKKHFDQNRDIIAGIIRLPFHDCFVRGCDASVLLEGEDTEKTALPNLTLDGFDIIEDIKVALDKYCPGVVSCADIIILAARAATFLGGADWYAVETGRKDGRISLASEAIKQLPSRDIPIPAAVDLFGSLGMSTSDFVYLLGCHTVGTAHCENVEERLYNFNNNGGSDPTMNPNLAATLRMKCPRNANSTEEIFLDQTKGSEFVMDNGFFKSIMQGKGILKVDQELALHPLTRDIVMRVAADDSVFKTRIGPAMRQLSLVGVLTEGEVRLGTCKKVR